VLVQSVRHFWPDLNDWLNAIPDRRDPRLITYDKRFLLWWGLCLYLFQLGSRRQLDFALDSRGTHVLDNLNRLAQTEQTTRPVHDTLEYFLQGVGAAPLARLRRQMLQRLIRSKVLEANRLQRRYLVVPDATGLVTFRRRHCPHCLVTHHQHGTLYHHQVLEAKLLGPAGVVLSMGSEFIDNSDLDLTLPEAERKQDCELKALSRLLPALRREYPQLSLCLAGDSLYACGRMLQLAKDHNCAYVLTFKPGRLPAVWEDFQALLKLTPANRLERPLPKGGRQVYRWVHELSYRDSDNRPWKFHAVQCEETVDGQTSVFAWITELKVDEHTVVDVATKGGRHRWHIENQGFNQQKNGGYNLEHVFSTDPKLLKAYYYLLQIAHMIMQLVEAGSLLRRLAAQYQLTPGQLFGGLKNIAPRLLECIRNFCLAARYFDVEQAGRLRVSIDSS
jgi:hypothetical protein